MGGPGARVWQCQWLLALVITFGSKCFQQLCRAGVVYATWRVSLLAGTAVLRSVVR